MLTWEDTRWAIRLGLKALVKETVIGDKRMRILLDEDLSVQLRYLFVGHEARTVRYMGWLGKVNGELLALARNEQERV